MLQKKAFYEFVEIFCLSGGNSSSFLQQFFWDPLKKNPTKIWGANPPLIMRISN
jgi:hypothetical protein